MHQLAAAAPAPVLTRLDGRRPLWRCLLATLAVLVVGSAAGAQAPPAESPAPARFEVVAVVLEDGGTSWAFMAEPELTQGALRKVMLGESVGPYRLVEVAADHIVMVGPEGEPLRVTFGLSGGAPPTVKAVRRGNRPTRARSERAAEDPAVRAERIVRVRERAAAAGPTPVDGSIEQVVRERVGTLPPETQARLDEWMRLRERRLREVQQGGGAPAQAGAPR